MEWWYTAASCARESTELYASKDLIEIKNYEKSGLERAISRSQAKDITLDYQKIEKEQEKVGNIHGKQIKGLSVNFPPVAYLHNENP